MQKPLDNQPCSSRGFFAEQSAKGDNQPRSAKIEFCNTLSCLMPSYRARLRYAPAYTVTNNQRPADVTTLS